MMRSIIVCFVALLNVLVIAFIPKIFTSESIQPKHELTPRYELIADAIKKGQIVSLEDREWLREQVETSTLEFYKKIKESPLSVGKTKIATGSLLQVSAISLVFLIILSILGLFGSVESLVYFSLTSMLIMLISSIGSGQLFLIIIVNMMLVFGSVHPMPFN